MNNWRYYWRRYFGWFPIQFCMVCGKWYWGGFPRWGWDLAFGDTRWRIRMTWAAWMQDYCSRQCADDDLEAIAAAHYAMYPNDRHTFDDDALDTSYEDHDLDYQDNYDDEGSDRGYD